MLKRNNWTNNEVINILKGLQLTGKFKSTKADKQFVADFNTGLDHAIEQFGDFNRPPTDYTAMALDTDRDMIVVVGPVLPR